MAMRRLRVGALLCGGWWGWLRVGSNANPTTNTHGDDFRDAGRDHRCLPSDHPGGSCCFGGVDFPLWFVAIIDSLAGRGMAEVVVGTIAIGLVGAIFLVFGGGIASILRRMR